MAKSSTLYSSFKVHAGAREHLDETRSAMTAGIPKAFRIMILLDGYEQVDGR